MDVLERAHELERERRHIIHLEVVGPDFPTPACICEAAVKALREEKTHYTHSLGLIELREAICEEYLNKYGMGVTPGIDFGSNAEGYLRFSYANSIDNIKTGLGRIEEFIRTRYSA